MKLKPALTFSRSPAAAARIARVLDTAISQRAQRSAAVSPASLNPISPASPQTAPNPDFSETGNVNANARPTIAIIRRGP